VKSRPRIPVEQKRRRGSATIKLKGAGQIVAALKKLTPEFRRRFVNAMNGELAVIGMDLAKGRDQTAEIEVKRGRDGKLKVREVRRAPRVRR
jgi:hypothetical protein